MVACSLSLKAGILAFEARLRGRNAYFVLDQSTIFDFLASGFPFVLTYESVALEITLLGLFSEGSYQNKYLGFFGLT